MPTHRSYPRCPHWEFSSAASGPQPSPARIARRREKIVRGLRGVEHRVVTLRPASAPRGAALFSHVLDPLLEPHDPSRPVLHSLHWEVQRMAETLVELGLEVDAVSWTNGTFVPERRYDLVVDVRTNLERWAPRLDAGTIKLLHCDTAHHAFHNRAQLERLARLEARRGIRLAPHRLLPENRTIEIADHATVLGNAFTLETWAAAATRRAPPSSASRCRVRGPTPGRATRTSPPPAAATSGSGPTASSHKGLDLALEAFAGLPGFELYVCGPLFREPAFERAYYRELYRTPNVHTLGWVDPGSPQFAAIARSSIGVVFPSCSEGGGVSALVGLHAGLLPVVTRESSVDLAAGLDPYLSTAEPAEIRERVQAIAARPPAELEAQARAAWEDVRSRHTREHFARRFRSVIERLMDGHGSARNDG